MDWDVLALASLVSTLLGWGTSDLLRGVYVWAAGDFAFALAGSVIVLAVYFRSRPGKRC